MTEILKGQSERPWSLRMADSLMKLRPDLSDKWSHEYGAVFKGIEHVWLKNKDESICTISKAILRLTSMSREILKDIR